MAKLRGILLVLLVLLVVGQAAALWFLHVREGWREDAGQRGIERGRRIAERMGCFGCHGPGGIDPIPNPDASYGEVPNWGDGTWMLWSRSPDDVRGWIRDGHAPTRVPDRNALISMPAYGDRLSASELDDLVGYVLAVARFGEIDDRSAAQGREIAARLGCFGCHGPEGRGLIANPGSLKGYIPAWDGEDYAELVRDDDEFRQWVREGISERFRSSPVKRRLLESQEIAMPGYGDRVTDEQLDALLAYVRWVRDHPRP